MKLSEAIRMNGMMKPQGFGERSIASPDAPCAIGGALQSIGKQDHVNVGNNYWLPLDEWLWMNGCWERCPEGHRGEKERILSVIFHLNDQHKWTRQQIADWVASVEPQEEAADSGLGTHCDSVEAELSRK